MMLTATQRRIGLGSALLLAIALTVVGEDRSIEVDTPKRPSAAPGETASAVVPGSAARAGATAEEPARIEVAKLSRRPPAADGVDVFAVKSLIKPPPVVRAPVEPAQPLAAPPLPFQYVGQMEGKDGTTVLISRGQESFSVRAGEPIDDDYRLESITGERLTILYLPLNERQFLDPENK